MLQNALDLTVSKQALEAEQVSVQEEEVPVWAAASLTVMRDNGIGLDATAEMTRADVAQVLYKTSILSVNAPGTAVFRMQQ